MHKLDKEYAGVTTTYPATIQTIVNDLCRYCGVVLQSARFDGYNVKLTKRPINSGITCRQVLSYAMQMICKFAKCDANGKLIVDWFDQQVFEQNTLLDGGIFDDDSPYSSGDEADGGTFSPWNTGYEHNSGRFEDMDAFHHIYTLDTLDVAVEDVIISGVQVTAETENTENADTLFYGEEGYVLKISGNPFIIKENAANFAEFLGKKLIGLIFRPLDASALPNPTVEAGDIAYISDGPSKSYSALVTNLSFDPDDNMSISCDAESPKKTESQRPTELEQTLAKMRKETENTLSNYDLIVQQMSQLAANTLGFHETKIIQDDGSVIVYRHDKPKLSESKIVYKSGIDGFFVTRNYTGKDSTTVWKAGFDSNGNAALNILSVIGIHWDWAYGGTLSLGGAGNGNGIMKVFDSNGVLISTQDTNGYFLYDKNGLIKAIINKDSIRLFSTPLNPNATEDSSYKGIQLNGDGFCRIEGAYYFNNGELSMEMSVAYDQFVSLSSEPDGDVNGNFDELLADVFWTMNATIEGGTATLDKLISKATKLLNVKQNTNAYDLLLMTDGTVTRAASSSKRYKDIGDAISEMDIDNWYKIEPVWAKYKDGYLAEGDENEGRYMPMFIAEDVEEHFPQAATHANNQIEDWNYRMMIPAMFAMIKQQKEEIESLKQAVKEMRGN